MLEISDWLNRASFRRLVPDFALFMPPARGLSVLRRGESISALRSFAVPRMLRLLPGRFTSGSSAVRGGLGGARLAAVVGFTGDEFLLLRSSFPFLVASGNISSGLPISSLLPTASRLCALLKVGYEPCGRTSPFERRSISGTTTEAFLGVLEARSGVLSGAAALGESRSRSRSRSRLPDFRVWMPN